MDTGLSQSQSQWKTAESGYVSVTHNDEFQADIFIHNIFSVNKHWKS